MKPILVVALTLALACGSGAPPPDEQVPEGEPPPEGGEVADEETRPSDEEIDPQNLTAEQLARFAREIRRLHGEPSGQRAFAFRRELMHWLMQTRQVTVVMCDFSAFVPTGEGRPWLAELTLSLAASVIEDGRDPADPASVIAAALRGLLTYYRAVLDEEGDAARNEKLEALAELERAGALDARAAEIASGCGDTSTMGVHFTADAYPR